MFWPLERRPKENGEMEDYYIDNLKHYPLTKATAWELDNYTQLYGRQGAGVYIDSVRNTHEHIHQYYSRQKIENDDVMYRRYCLGAKANWGRLWNKSLAFLYGVPYMKGQGVAQDNYCPLCGHTDSSGHILGGCGHQAMKALYIDRHNKAVERICKAIRAGELGGDFMIANISDDRVQNLGWLKNTKMAASRG